jgi:uncharacterized protein YbcV (DUF1398 family)
MDALLVALTERCLRGAEDDTMTFPDIVRTLAEAGFEGYAIDFRALKATYYLRDGASAVLEIHAAAVVAPAFDAAPILAAIREAQALAPGYSYRRFCQKVAAAGCAGYLVSFSGRRALYYGRTAETHVELFPN